MLRSIILHYAPNGRRVYITIGYTTIGIIINVTCTIRLNTSQRTHICPTYPAIVMLAYLRCILVTHTHIVQIIFCIQIVIIITELVHTKFCLEANFAKTFLTALSSNQDYTIISTRTIDSCSTSILHYFH